MLLAMVLRSRGPAYRLMLATALFGVAWNVGELTAHLLDGLHLAAARNWLSATSYAALGFLAAVVVHSAARADSADVATSSRRASRVGIAAYTCALIAAVMHWTGAATGGTLPSSTGLILLTIGLTVLSLALLVVSRRHPRNRRPAWMIGLALFAVSALHLGRFHGASESWTTELLGHHASIPLAFAILYQDYRFAFADLFLKRALTLLALVTAVFVGWTLVGPTITSGAAEGISIGVLLALWIATALAFPAMKRAAELFVDRIVLKRSNYVRILRAQINPHFLFND